MTDPTGELARELERARSNGCVGHPKGGHSAAWKQPARCGEDLRRAVVLGHRTRSGTFSRFMTRDP